MSERVTLFRTWPAHIEPEWTGVFYRQFGRSRSDFCGCEYCRLWGEQRERVLCEGCRSELQRYGVDWKIDTGNGYAELDDHRVVYYVQYRLKGTLAEKSSEREYACPVCSTKVWIHQDRWERNWIVIDMAVNLQTRAEEKKGA